MLIGAGPSTEEQEASDTDWEIYEESFKGPITRTARIGVLSQATIPNRLLPESEIQREPVYQDIAMWDPSVLSVVQVDNYLVSARQAWPHNQFTFVEEAALFYLALKDYDCTKALDAIVHNVDEVISLMRTLYNRFHVSTNSNSNTIQRLCSIGGIEFQSMNKVQRSEERLKA